MATEQVSVDLDDRALFDFAQQAPETTSPPPDQGAQPEPAAPPQQPSSQEAAPTGPAEQPRDERGRFTSGGRFVTEGAAPPPQAPAAPAPPPAGDEGTVPSWRLREEREAREAYAARLAESDRRLAEVVGYLQRMRAAQPGTEQAIDPLVDPGGWQARQERQFHELQAQFAHQLRTNQLESNLQLTRMERGAELFDAAYTAFLESADGDVLFARSIVNSPNPGAAMCDWYESARTLQTYGRDPEAYFQQRVAGLLKDPAFLHKAIDAARGLATAPGGRPPGQPSNVTMIPPSLSSMRSGSSGEYDAGAGMGDVDPMSDSALFAGALAPGQARR